MSQIIRQVPNALTAFRLFAAPALALLLHEHHDAGALFLFILAGLSDAVDGYLAKRLASPSRFGAYLDPAADKLLMLVAFIILTQLGATHLWLTALVIGRDVAIVLGLMLGLALGLPLVVAPLTIGKVSTVVQVCYVGLILLLRALQLNLGTLQAPVEIIVAAVTTLSWLAYGQLLFRAFSLRRRTA